MAMRRIKNPTIIMAMSDEGEGSPRPITVLTHPMSPEEV